MSARLLAAALLVFLPPDQAQSDITLSEVQERVPALIEQLGSQKYAERRAAQRELTRIGLIAFDRLYAARQHDDPEIATTAERLLGQMTIRWAQPADSSAVREQLELYGRLDAKERADVVGELSALDMRQGLSALCRIARFDLSSSVAADAAVAVMTMPGSRDEPGQEGSPLAVPEGFQDALTERLAELDQLYGPSSRESSAWLRWFADRTGEPEAVVQRWEEELSRLRALERRNKSAVSSGVLNVLSWNLLRSQLKSGQQDRSVVTARSLAEANPQVALAVWRRALDWMVEAQADTALDRALADAPDSVLFKSQRGLYLAAKTRLKQGREQEAERLARLAFEAEPGPQEVLGRRGGQPVLAGRVVVGFRLRRENHPDWAMRELRQALDEEGPLSPEGAFAAWELADVLQDAAQYAEASRVLREFVAAVNKDEPSRNTYNRIVENRDELFRPIDELAASEAQFRAMGHRESGDLDAEQAALLEAIERDEKNADILIAMYHCGPPEYPMREDARDRIRVQSDRFEEKIDQDSQQSLHYNQWAWLISNTEGDYAKAIRYSLRSLELSPGNAGYLDTLGRCYYAAGELEKAVEAQREAVTREPQFKVMQRQLALFEKELAKRASNPQ